MEEKTRIGVKRKNDIFHDGKMDTKKKRSSGAKRKKRELKDKQ